MSFATSNGKIQAYIFAEKNEIFQFWAMWHN